MLPDVYEKNFGYVYQLATAVGEIRIQIAFKTATKGITNAAIVRGRCMSLEPRLLQPLLGLAFQYLPQDLEK